MKKLNKLTKKMEQLSEKRSREESDSDSDAWGCGSGSIGEVVVDVCTDVLQRKTKKLKLDNSSSPIKTTQLEPNSSGFQYEKSSHSPLLKSIGIGVTAVMAMLEEPTGDQPGWPSKTAKYKSQYKKPKTSSKKVQKLKPIRVLLDSGSDGDLLFHKKGAPKCFPTRQVPKSWCTSNGNFHTEGRGKLKLEFFKYSNSKRVSVRPDVVEYDGDKLKRPVFMAMVHTSELDMADSVAPNDIDALLTNVSWAIRSTYHTVLKASPGVAVFGRDMLFDIPSIADWRKIGDYRQRQTDL